MSPEFQILTINAVIMAVAYGGIYPSLSDKTIGPVMRTDLALTGLSLTVASALFAGRGHGFDMLLFETNWFLFALISLAVMEAPLFWRFCRRHDIDLGGGRE